MRDVSAGIAVEVGLQRSPMRCARVGARKWSKLSVWPVIEGVTSDCDDLYRDDVITSRNLVGETGWNPSIN